MISSFLKKTGLITAALLFSMGVGAALTQAQPIVDSVRAIQLRNEKMYRQMNAMSDAGASYEFTNVTAWKIVDPELQEQLIQVVRHQPWGEKRLDKIDIDRVYLFSTQTGPDGGFEPFHILFIGQRQREAQDSSGAEDPFGIGGSRRSSSGQDLFIAFKGKDVVRLMQRQPTLVENINAIQGENFELPGDILPSGVQLIKSSAQRYIFHQMFEGFYSKRQVIDEQRRRLGLPTSDEEFVPDTMALEVMVDPDQTAALPDEELANRAFRYDKTFDLSAEHLRVGLNRNTALELQLGFPEVGLPFWTAGQGRFWLNLKNQIGSESNFKIGLDFPLPHGFGDQDQLLFTKRSLSGFWGGSVDAYFAGLDFFSAFNMPVAFNFTVLPAGVKNGGIITTGGPDYFGVDGSKTFYRTTFIGQLYIPIIVQLDPSNFLQFSAGVGIHTVMQSIIPTKRDTAALIAIGKSHEIDHVVDLQRVSTPVTPHVGIEFVNHRVNKFGLGMQYDHLFTFSGWIELIDNFLRIETSYTTPLVRDAKPYEPDGFFMLTPRFYF